MLSFSSCPLKVLKLKSFTWTNASSSYISLTYCQRCVNSSGMSKFSKYLPATRMCCNFGINSQSKQQSVSPVKNRVPFSAKVSSNLYKKWKDLFVINFSGCVPQNYIDFKWQQDWIQGKQKNAFKWQKT